MWGFMGKAVPINELPPALKPEGLISLDDEAFSVVKQFLEEKRLGEQSLNRPLQQMTS